MALAKLTTLTPVHIGSGEKLLRDFDFIAKDGKVGFLDLQKVVEKIGIERLPQLTSEIEKKNVKSYLERTIPNVPFEDLCHRVATNNAPNSNCNELKEQYRTALFNACIPGSSIKGALKTILLEKIANSEFLEKLSPDDYGKLKYNKRTRQEERAFKDGEIEQKIFGPNANEKTTRFLKIGDIHFPTITTSVYEIGILNAGYNDWQFKNNSSFLAECIPVNASSAFQFKLDEEWFKLNKRYYPGKWGTPSTSLIEKDIRAFCSLLNSYTSRLINYEFEDLEETRFDANASGNDMLDKLEQIRNIADEAIKNQSNFGILRVGGNSGWNFTTGGWVKSTSLPNNEYNDMRRIIQRGKTYDMDLWPKTRKLTTSGLPLGFVKIEF